MRRASAVALLCCYLPTALQGTAFALQTTEVKRTVYRDVLSLEPTSLHDENTERKEWELSSVPDEPARTYFEEDLPKDGATLKAFGSAADPAVFEDAPAAALHASRLRFRELFFSEADEGSLDGFEPDFVGTLADESLPTVALKSDAPDGLRLTLASANSSLSSGKTYTVVGGQIVEVELNGLEDEPFAGHGFSGSEGQIWKEGEFLSFEGELIGPDPEVEVLPKGPAQKVAELSGLEESSALAMTWVPQGLHASFAQPDQSFAEFVASRWGQNQSRETADASGQIEAAWNAAFAKAESTTGESRSAHAHVASFMGGDQEGQHRLMLRGRVAVPRGVDARQVVVRVAGTNVQTYPDKEGFFEMGPFPKGSSFELLVFDLDSSLNRRLVPVFISSEMRERQINLIRSADVIALQRSFGVEEGLTQAGLCGQILSQADVRDGELRVRVVSPDGEEQRLSYHSALGFPSRDQRVLSSSKKFCALGLSSGNYRVEVMSRNHRQSYVVHLRPSIFENDLVFDLNEHGFVNLKGLSLVDSEEALSSLNSSGSWLSFQKPLQNFWLSGRDKALWTPVLDYQLRPEPLYSAAVVSHEENLQFVPLGQELVKFFDEVSRSFEFLGRDHVLSAQRKKATLAHKMVSEDTTRDLRMLVPDSVDPDEFIAFGDFDAALFDLESGEEPLVQVRDIWTGETVGKVSLLSQPGDRLLRVVASDLPEGTHVLTIHSSSEKLHWSSVLRSGASETQILSNMNF